MKAAGSSGSSTQSASFMAALASARCQPGWGVAPRARCAFICARATVQACCVEPGRWLLALSKASCAASSSRPASISRSSTKMLKPSSWSPVRPKRPCLALTRASSRRPWRCRARACRRARRTETSRCSGRDSSAGMRAGICCTMVSMLVGSSTTNCSPSFSQSSWSTSCPGAALRSWSMACCTSTRACVASPSAAATSAKRVASTASSQAR